jgi:hypothetical protein
MATLTPHDAARLGKIVGLIDSPVDGESRAAIEHVKKFVRARPHIFDGAAPAKAADRLTQPKTGTPEYFEQRRSWKRKYEYLSVHRNSPLLTASDLRLIKNLIRYCGVPYDIATAERIDRLCDRLREEERKDNG